MWQEDKIFKSCEGEKLQGNDLKMEFGNRDCFNLINISFSSDQHLCDHLKV